MSTGEDRAGASPSGEGGKEKLRRRAQRQPTPAISEIEPAESDDDQSRRRPRPPAARRLDRVLQETESKELAEGGRWSICSAEAATLVCSIVICVVAAKYLENLPQDADRKVFTKEELARYDGSSGGPIYLAFVGQVFDVSKGKQYYGKGGGYDFFAGRDATRAFVSGDFEKDLTDDLTGFTPEEFRSLMEWRSFYHKDYKYMGKVEGRFYNPLGEPLEDLQKFEDGAAEGNRIAELRKAERAKYPNCNSKWSQAKGGEVWCKEGYYPRRVMEPSSGARLKMRCACFKDQQHSDLRQLYDGCSPDESRCRTAPAQKGGKAGKAGNAGSDNKAKVGAA
ncbi:unnamed protein product [Ostreobium quekettii]|uniref:Cytochrome b5 heme-binding domain-containing protein n=1 Tax=Ostreobium quekettii TaxID=121088 RepID=A0A8S1J335_9CHLO|nr:unnamed protein product [Ostreobium quekettii]|eukprot:evm.model.scf_1928.3 EVM.evm.TU.scf_1928.3   scf_1928:15337-20968(+)